MLIIPAPLTKTSNEAIEQLDEIRGAAPWVQIDVMDGTMTPESNYDLFELVGHTNDFEVEVHIMSTDPAAYFEACAAIGASRVYFHLGEVESPGKVLSAMDGYDFARGICLSPQTPAEDVFPYIDEIDAVQIMTVVPGAQGAQFLPDMLEKISYVRERRTEIWISVDGGVNLKTIEEVAVTQLDAAGVGSAISKASEPVEIYGALVVAAQKAEIV